VEGLLRRVAVEEGRELSDAEPVAERVWDMRPLTRVAALGEEPAELVERRPAEQDAVRVVVDQADPGQYFKK
jgi:hypothetical protein